ncbi:MAG: hypothetical protein AAFX46_21485, partial [Cyanobacteria bacterium J06636_27]
PDIDIPTINNPESLGTNTIENQNNLNQGIFTLPTDKNLKFSIDNIRTKNPSEIGIFIVDDEQGTINGIAPDSPDYIKLALERAKVIFSTIPNPPDGLNLNEIQRILELDSQRQFGFYTIPNGTKDTILQQINQTGKTNLPVLFSNSSQIKVDNLNQNGFTFELSDISLNVEFAEDTPAIGTKLQTQIELIDLRDQIGLLPVNIQVYREAKYNNTIGFYQVTDIEGGIDINGDGITDIKPGEQGYKQAAINNRITSIDLLQTKNQKTSSYDGILNGGSIISPFMVVDGTMEQAITGEAKVSLSRYLNYQYLLLAVRIKLLLLL